MRLALCALAVVAVVGFSGCNMAMSPVVAAITIDERGPVAMGDAKVNATKTGYSKAQGILLVAFGDASIKAAMQDAGITRVHHVDSEVLNIFGLYARYQTMVYGE
jgi:hypothetical protein